MSYGACVVEGHFFLHELNNKLFLLSVLKKINSSSAGNQVTVSTGLIRDFFFFFHFLKLGPEVATLT